MSQKNIAKQIKRVLPLFNDKGELERINLEGATYDARTISKTHSDPEAIKAFKKRAKKSHSALIVFAMPNSAKWYDYLIELDEGTDKSYIPIRESDFRGGRTFYAVGKTLYKDAFSAALAFNPLNL